MADIIDKDKAVKMGTVIAVNNTNLRWRRENETYEAVWVEDLDGGNERCLLFSTLVAKNMETVQMDWLIDELKYGRLYPITVGNLKTNIVKVRFKDNELLWRLSKTQLQQAERRALLNPEDLPKRSLLTNITD